MGTRHDEVRYPPQTRKCQLTEVIVKERELERGRRRRERERERERERDRERHR